MAAQEEEQIQTNNKMCCRCKFVESKMCKCAKTMCEHALEVKTFAQQPPDF